MKKLTDFKENKVDLHQIKGGGPSPSSYIIIMHGPPGTEPNWIEDAVYDYPSNDGVQCSVCK